MKKSTRKKLSAITLVACMATSIMVSPRVVDAINIESTGAKVINNYAFSEALEKIENETEVTFNNPDLYRIVASNFNGSFTTSDLKTITTIIIPETLSNNDLRDLRYLTNLERIIVRNNNVNCKDLEYNQKLKQVILDTCNISHTEDLPNTVKYLEIGYSDIYNDVLSIPYSVDDIYIMSTSFNKIHFKNPESLKQFYFAGYGILDLEDLKSCTNLESLSLLSCPNIVNSQYLARFAKIQSLKLDEFASIWLDANTLNALNNFDTSTYNSLASTIKRLDEIAVSIIDSNMSEEEKLNEIIKYVVNQIEYDYASLEDTESGRRLLSYYNSVPITSALDQNSGVCVGYASLLKALANRAGIDNYQPDSENHTWNMIRLEGESEYTAYDATALDGQYATVKTEDPYPIVDPNHNSIYYIDNGLQDQLEYYSFDIDSMDTPTYQTTIDGIRIDDVDIDIGYIKGAMAKTTSSPEKDRNIRINTAKFETLTLLAYYLISNCIDSVRFSRKNRGIEKRIAKRKEYRRLHS